MSLYHVIVEDADDEGTEFAVRATSADEASDKAHAAARNMDIDVETTYVVGEIETITGGMTAI